MALFTLSGIGYGGSAGQRLNMILQELQNKSIAVITGGAAATSLTFPANSSGAVPEYTDSLLSVVQYAGGVPSDITSDASILDRRAKGTLTLASVVAGDTALVNGKTYTAVAASSNFANSGAKLPLTFQVGATDTITAANLAAAINAYSTVVTVSSAAAVVTVRAIALGTAGNSVALGTTTHFTPSASMLAGGTATNAMVLATTNSTGNKLVVSWAKKPSVAV